VLAFWDNGFRHFTNRVRPIRKPADCRGLKIRTLDNALHQEVFRALGFEPMQIDVKDFPAAVASGAVDAQDNPLTNIVNFGVYRTHRHITLTSHFFGIALLLANRARFDAWPAEVRDAFRAAIAPATRLQRDLAAQEDIDCLALLQKDGCEIVAGDAIDRAAFDAAVADIRRRELARIDPEIAAAY
jgi:TRAP-type C4-dicarboxylate transport system substrate-binding protein